jgi:DNA modification methylase
MVQSATVIPALSRTSVLSDPSFAHNRRASIHRWVPWVAGFSADFVSDCLANYAGTKPHDATWVLDPFAGVGTTIVESFLQGRNVIGFEINPYAALATRVKLNAGRIPEAMLARQIKAFEAFLDRHSQNGKSVPQTKPPEGFSGRTQLFNPKVEQKVLFVLDFISSIEDSRIRDLFRLALGSVMVTFSNYSYEPSLTRRSAVGKPPIEDYDVGQSICQKLMVMLDDIVWLGERTRRFNHRIDARVYTSSIFAAPQKLKRIGFVDIVVTSPPYLNNYHYPRNTRPQLHWLGLGSGAGYKGAREEQSFGKFWQTVRDAPPVELTFALPELQKAMASIRSLNIQKGAYGGPGWANYIATYFNDTFKFCRLLERLLRPGGIALIVLGNSIIQGVEVKTDCFFGKIASMCGMNFKDTLVLRKKRTGSSIIKSSVRVDAPPARVELYEAAIVLRKPR